MTFTHALESVHQALVQMQAHGVQLRASSASLHRLQSSRAPSPSAPTKAALDEKAQRLEGLRAVMFPCAKCPRTGTAQGRGVFGRGSADAQVIFIGDTVDEDEPPSSAEPFSGEAGGLLTKIIEAMGFQPGEVYLTNVLKCRPLEGRAPEEDAASDHRVAQPAANPTPDEFESCLAILREEISIIQPRLVVALGATAMRALTGASAPMGELRGHWHDFEGTPLLPTYHPSYLLRRPALSERRKLWEDMLLVLERLEKPISNRQRSFFLPKTAERDC